MGPHFDGGFLTFVGPLSFLICALIHARLCWATRQFHFISAQMESQLTLCKLSSCRRRIIPACRSKIWQGNGSTCRHVRTHSSLISEKVRHRIGITITDCVLNRILGCAAYTGLESVTQGLARATSHRVLAPPAGTSPRYSIPFFQNIAQHVRLSEQVLECASRPLETCCTFSHARIFKSPLKCLRSKGSVVSLAR